MPSETPKQKIAMAIACHHPEKSTAGIPQDVACEFNRADAAKAKRAKRKVREAVEYLETLKMIENVRNMSFTSFLVENATKRQAPDVMSLLSQISDEAQRAVQDKAPGAMAFWQRVQRSMKDPNPQARLMGAVNAQSAFRAMKEGLSQEDADVLVEATTYNVPAGADFKQVEKMYHAAKRGMSIADKIKDPESRKKHKSRVHGNFNKLKARYEKMKKEHGSVKEAWDKEDVVSPREKGKYDGWSVSELEAERSTLMAKDKRTEAESNKVHELDFALRAKKAKGGKWAGVTAKEGAEVTRDVLEEKRKPSAGLTKPQKKRIVKKAKRGEHVIGGGFKKIEKSAKKGGARDPKAVAAAQMWKMKAKQAAARESVEFSAPEVDFIVESAFEYQKMMKKLNKVFEKYLDPADYDNKEAIIKVAMEHAAEKVDGFDVMTADEKMELIVETCMKYDLAEAFDDEPPEGMDDPEAFSQGVGPDDQQIGPPQTSVSRSGFKLEPEEIGKVAEIIAQYTDFPPEDKSMASAIERLQYADLFHLTPQEAVTARRLLAAASRTVGA